MARRVVPLTEREKIEILFMKREQKGICEIARELARSESTIRSFLKSYESRRMLFPKRGRPRRVVAEDLQKGLIGELIQDPILSIRDQMNDESPGDVWKLET
jgi:IS30 family transposase